MDKKIGFISLVVLAAIIAGCTQQDIQQPQTTTQDITPTPSTPTPQEALEEQDKDDDGLVLNEENRIGTDPENEDTDQDGIIDGVDVRYGNPLHMDLYLTLIFDKERFSEYEYETVYIESKLKKINDAFENAPVSNPDGSTGINFHSTTVRADPDVYISNANTSWSSIQHWGIITSRERGTLLYGGQGNIAGNRFTIYSIDTITIMHELGHNILGTLDEKNQAEEDPNHCKYTCYVMYSQQCPLTHFPYHPNVWEEIERDGLLGLSKYGQRATI